MGSVRIKDEDFERNKKKPKEKKEEYVYPKQSNFIEAKKNFWKDAEEKEMQEKEEKEEGVVPLTSENLSLKESIEKVKSWKKQLTDTPPDTPPSTLGRQISSEQNKDFRKSDLNKADSAKKSHSKQQQQKQKKNEKAQDWNNKQSEFKPKPRPTYAGLPQFPVRKKMVESDSESSSTASSSSSSESSSSSSSSSSSAADQNRVPSPYDNLTSLKPPAPKKCTLAPMKLKSFMGPPTDDRPISPYDNLPGEKAPPTNQRPPPGKLWGARSPAHEESSDRDDVSSAVSSTVNSEDDEGTQFLSVMSFGRVISACNLFKRFRKWLFVSIYQMKRRPHVC